MTMSLWAPHQGGVQHYLYFKFPMMIPTIHQEVVVQWMSIPAVLSNREKIKPPTSMYWVTTLKQETFTYKISKSS